MSNFSGALFTAPIHPSEDKDKLPTVTTPLSDALRSACGLGGTYPAPCQAGSGHTGSQVCLGTSLCRRPRHPLPHQHNKPGSSD